MKNKIIVSAVAILAVLAIATFLLSKKPVSSGSAGVGATFNSAKIAEINMTPSTGTATSTSIYNGDDDDRIVTDAFASCSGIGTSYTAYTGTGLTSAGLLLKAATTTTSAPASVTNTNLAMSISIATTTPSDMYVATSTYGTAYWQRWGAGTYMTFFTNATNTAACSIGVHYIGT